MSERENAGQAPAELPPLALWPTLEEWLADPGQYSVPGSTWFVCTGDLLVVTAVRLSEGRSETYVREVWIDRKAEVRPEPHEANYSWRVQVLRGSDGKSVGVHVLSRVEIRAPRGGAPDERTFMRARGFKLCGTALIVVEDLTEWRQMLMDAMSRERGELKIESREAKKAG